MIQEQYLPAICHQMMMQIDSKLGTRHRHTVIRSPLVLSRRSSEQVIECLRKNFGVHALPYFVDGERSSKSVLVDMTLLEFKRTRTR